MAFADVWQRYPSSVDMPLKRHYTLTIHSSWICPILDRTRKFNWSTRTKGIQWVWHHCFLGYLTLWNIQNYFIYNSGSDVRDNGILLNLLTQVVESLLSFFLRMRAIIKRWATGRHGLDSLPTSILSPGGEIGRFIGSYRVHTSCSSRFWGYHLTNHVMESLGTISRPTISDYNLSFRRGDQCVHILCTTVWHDRQHQTCCDSISVIERITRLLLQISHLSIMMMMIIVFKSHTSLRSPVSPKLLQVLLILIDLPNR